MCDSLRTKLQDVVDAVGSFDDYVGLSVSDAVQLYSTGTTTAIEEVPGDEQLDFTLEANYPNPFRTATHKRYNLMRPTMVSLSVYDLQGRVIRMLQSGRQREGVHSVLWYCTDDAGRRVASGDYFVGLKTGSHQVSIAVIVRRQSHLVQHCEALKIAVK